jgi:hypothetical protein
MHYHMGSRDLDANDDADAATHAGGVAAAWGPHAPAWRRPFSSISRWGTFHARHTRSPRERWRTLLTPLRQRLSALRTPPLRHRWP